MKKNAPTRQSESKFFFIELYTEWENLSILIKKICSYSVNYAFILHDKDTYESGEEQGQLKKSHIHLLSEIATKRTINGFYGLFEHIEGSFKPNLIQVVGSLNKCLRYLTHIDYPEKYQYEYKGIATNDNNWLAENYQKQISTEKYIQKIEDYIFTREGYISNKSMIEWIRQDVKMSEVYHKKSSYFVGLIKDHNYEVKQTIDIETVNDRINAKAYMDAKKQDSEIAKLVETFDRVKVFDTDDMEIELMAVSDKK